MKKTVQKIVALALLVSVFFLARRGAAFVSARAADAGQKQPCIVIDAGHGSNDPGKVGVNGALEKDINLAIALRLAKILENKGYEVVLTRETDETRADKQAPNRKRADMAERVKIIEEAQPVLTISIHQNSFSNSSVCGPQVFYYKESKQGKDYAAAIQASLDERLKPQSPRKTKANSEYYLLRKTPVPTVIVECGFLSNPQEAERLTDGLYQDKVARAIYFGVQAALGEP